MMATKPATTAEAPAPDTDAETTLDTQSGAVKRLIAKGKERGYITFDELNAVLPPEQNSSEQIEDVMSMLSEMGIQVVESEESEEGEVVAAKPEVEDEEAAEQTGNINAETAGRTDDDRWLVREPPDVPRHRCLARSAEDREDPAARRDRLGGHSGHGQSARRGRKRRTGSLAAGV